MQIPVFQDQYIGNYHSRRVTYRWTVRIWQWLLDLCAMTAYKTFIMANQGSAEATMTRRDFIRNLAMGLMEPQWKVNESVDPLPVRTRRILAIVAAIEKFRCTFAPRAFAIEEKTPKEKLSELSATPPKKGNNSDTRPSSSVGNSSRSHSSSQPSQSRSSSRMDKSYFQKTPTSSRSASRKTNSTPAVKEDTRSRSYCYAAPCKLRRSRTGHYCELCYRPICLTHGEATRNEKNEIVVVVCRSTNSETYCMEESPPRKSRKIQKRHQSKNDEENEPPAGRARRPMVHLRQEGENWAVESVTYPTGDVSGEEASAGLGASAFRPLSFSQEIAD